MKRFLGLCLLLGLCGGVCLAASPAAIRHISFEDNFGGAAYVDNQGGVAGDIQYVAGGPVGKYAQFTNPSSTNQGDSLRFTEGLRDSGTIALWVKLLPALNGQAPTLWDASIAGNQWKSHYSGTAPNYTIYTRIHGTLWEPVTVGGLAGDTWYHYLFTWERPVGSEKLMTHLYLNGAPVHSREQTWVAPSNELNIGGAFSWYAKFAGGMDDVYLFDVALDADQVEALYTQSIAGQLATDPYPFVGTEIEDTTAVLSWTAPTGVASPTYDVYIAESADDLDSVTPIATPSTSVEVALDRGKTYYWKVDVIGGAASSDAVVWMFRVQQADDRLVALRHISFTDTHFGGATYIGGQSGVSGDIQIVSGGPVGNYGLFDNPVTHNQGDFLQLDLGPQNSGSIAMWVKLLPALSGQAPTLWDASLAGNQWKAHYSGTAPNYVIYSRLHGSLWEPTVLTGLDGQTWYHYLTTWERPGQAGKALTRTYLNGQLLAESTQTWTEPANVFNIGGAFSWYVKFSGGMDEVYIFDDALNAEQAATLYAQTGAGRLATDPVPFVGKVSLARAMGNLSWTAPENVAEPTYDVYFGTRPELAVSDRIAAGISAATTDIPAGCVTDQRYYWRVDVNDDGDVETGIVWSFTPAYLDSDINRDGFVDMTDFAVIAANYGVSNWSEGSDWLIDDFESYNPLPGHPNVLSNWHIIPPNNEWYTSMISKVGSVELDVDQDDPRDGGGQYLVYDYDLSEGYFSHGLAEFYYAFDTPQDLSEYTRFEMYINCEAGNSHEEFFYVKLFQGGIGCGGTRGEYRLYPSLYQVSSPNPTTDQETGWQKIAVSLSGYEDLTDIHGFQIGTSSAAFFPYLDAFGTGTVKIDDVRFVFESECLGPIDGDINGDCVVDILDLAELASEWLK